MPAIVKTMVRVWAVIAALSSPLKAASNSCLVAVNCVCHEAVKPPVHRLEAPVDHLEVQVHALLQRAEILAGGHVRPADRWEMLHQRHRVLATHPPADCTARDATVRPLPCQDGRTGGSATAAAWVSRCGWG